MSRTVIGSLCCGFLGCAPQPLSPSAEPLVSAEQTTSPAGEHGPPPTVVADDELTRARTDASVGVVDPRVAQLLEAHWMWTLERYPEFATRLGVRAYDDRLSDRSLAAEAANRQARQDWLAQAQAIDLTGLGPEDRLTLTLFRDELQVELATDVCEFSHWNVSARGTVVGSIDDLPDLHRVATLRDANNLLARYRGIARSIDGTLERLRAGAAAGKFGNAESMRRAVEMAKKLVATPTSEWALMRPAKEAHNDWPAADVRNFHDSVVQTIDGVLRPAVQRYAAFVENELSPRARDEKNSGLVALQDGEACYQALIREYTTLDLTADEIHRTGLAEIERINNEMMVLGQRLFGTRKLPKILERLRTDPALHFATADEVKSFAEAALADAKAKMPAFFGRLPQADCTVVPIPDLSAPYTTIAYYEAPFPDGSKPGEYFINTYAPTTRPRYEARALAYHESIPGHHLQIAIAQELPQVPAFRRHGGQTVFVEGWALYTERLADEMALYVDDLDRMGVLSFDAWRAGRLVVDTGIHAKGWSRKQAVDYLRKHTALAANNIDNEVDRYISTPGQALAYKIGQLEILKLRREAEAALGPKFDIRAFHDVVLGAGAVPLSVLRERVGTYAASG